MNCVSRATSPLVAEAPLRLQLLLHGSLRENGVPGQLADPPGAVADGAKVDGRDAALVAANGSRLATVVVGIGKLPRGRKVQAGKGRGLLEQMTGRRRLVS
jgi:hypothetical protein